MWHYMILPTLQWYEGTPDEPSVPGGALDLEIAFITLRRRNRRRWL